MIELQNGCEVFLEAPHHTMENATVVMAHENGPLKVVCWVVDREGYAYWGAYGKESAEHAFKDRTVKTRKYRVVITAAYLYEIDAESEEEAEGLALDYKLIPERLMDDVSVAVELADE